MKRKLHLLIALGLALVVSSGFYAATFTSAANILPVGQTGGDIANGNISVTQPDWSVILTDLSTSNKTAGEVPSGDLFEGVPDPTFTGDIRAKLYLTNTGNLSKAYSYLNMKVFVAGSVEAGQTPNYTLLTLQNGGTAITVADISGTSGSFSQTSQADFNGGTLTQVETTTSPGNVLLDTFSGNVTDTYDDGTKISSLVNVTRSGGQIALDSGGASGTETYRPNDVGDDTDILFQTPGTGDHFDKVNEVIADNLTTYVSTNSTVYQRDLYQIPNHGSSDEIINNVTAYFRFGKTSGAGADDDFAVVYAGQGSQSDGFIATVDIDTSGQIATSLTDILEYDTANGEEPDILLIAGNIYVIAYDGDAADGWLATVEITNDGSITSTLVDTFEFNATSGGEPDLVHVSGDIYAIAYKGPGQDGWLTTVQIANDGTITQSVIDSLEFDTQSGATPSIVHVIGDFYAIAYTGRFTDGWMVTVEIDSAGQITNSVIDSFEFDTVDATRPSMVSVASDVVAIAYEGPSSLGYLIAVEIASNGLINNTIIDTLQFDTTQANEPDIINVSGDYFAIAHRGPGNDGWLTTVQIDSAGSITDTVVDTLEFDTAEGYEPSITNVSGDYYVIAYRGTGATGWMATVEIDSLGQITNSVVDTFEFDTVAAVTPRIIFVPDVSGSVYARAAIKTDGTVFTGTEESATDTSFALQSYQWTTNPFTSSAWTWSDINALQIGAELRTDDLSETSILTQVYIEVNYTSYTASGTVDSINLLLAENVSSIDSFDYIAPAIPSGTTLQVQFSTDNSNWYNSAGALGGYDTLLAGSNNIDLSGLGWSGANYYYHLLFTSDGTATPVIDEVRVNFSAYYSTGDLISSVYDTGGDLAWEWGTISFSVSEPGSTDVNFQIRTAATEGGLTSATWYGPTGTGDFYQTSGTLINVTHDGDRWIQYRAYLDDGSTQVTPVFSDITITYSALSAVYTIEIIGGGYSLVSDNTSEWETGWSTVPEIFLELTPR